MDFSPKWLLLCVLFLSSCSGSRHGRVKHDDGKLEVVFVQVNDVYEIAPLSNGKAGGLGRIATMKKSYVKTNPNTFLVMSGDFLSPSVYNTLKFQGKEILGKQMVEAMNAVGFDYVVFGNHEFDLSEQELQKRINESNFEWISSNAFHVKEGSVAPFIKDTPSRSYFPTYKIVSLTDEDGTWARIGIIGLVIPFNRKAYVKYEDPLSKAGEIYNQIKDSCDVIIALTHQLIADDEKLARELPQLTAIIGGHEHDKRFEKIGNVFITKAHANARTAFVIRIQIDKKNKRATATPELKDLDEKIAIDSVTDAVVQKWLKIADGNFASLGFNPHNVVINAGDSLDGREAVARNRSTNLTKLITQAMAFSCPQSDVAIMNAGSIRVDDILYPPISEYDVLRTLPFGKGMWEVDMKGEVLNRVLQTGRANKGSGAYLHAYDVAYDSVANNWLIKGQRIDSSKIYRVSLTDFLLTGQESNLGFLNRDSSGILKVYPQQSAAQADIRLAVIEYLRRK